MNLQWPDGEQGDTGDPGERGDRGESGPPGPQGYVGDAGDEGEVGFAGDQGLIGAKGEPGATGEKGIAGLPAKVTAADQGEPGIKGPKGIKGAPGFAGCPGKQGETGSLGDQGKKGPEGPQGPIGKTGMDGNKGERGRAGPMGQNGRVGRKGFQGEKGSKGDIGEVGNIGKLGVQGTTGIPGPVDKDFSVRQGPRGPPGTDGNVTCTLDPLENPDDFQGLHGEKGEPGSDGPFGPFGEKGVKGDACDCNEFNDEIELKGPRGVAGPSGTKVEEIEIKGDQGHRMNCNCSDKCITLPTVPDTKPKGEHIVWLPQNVAGSVGEKGEKGEKGDPGPGAKGDKGEEGPQGKGTCCQKPPPERTYGRTPTIYVVHSQSTSESIDCLDSQSVLLWRGFSFLYGDVNRVSTSQDLGKPGSCVPRLDPIPYTDCTPGAPCQRNQLSMQAIWLLAREANTSTQVPFSRLEGAVSRCAVCMAKAPIITLHRQTQCPSKTRQLWQGYSLAMFTSSMLSISVDLSHSGSCVPHFQTGLVIECDSSKNCRKYPDLRSHWLHGIGDKVPGEEPNCVVCIDERSNDFKRNLPKPQIYAEHYQSPIAPLNPCSSAPGIFPIMTNGYSLLHLEDTRANVQDLGSSGSCMPAFSPVPFLTCPTFGSCYAKERQTKTSWLSGIHISSLSNGRLNPQTTPSILSRCSICVSDGPIVTIHSHDTSVPQCPTRGGRWASLWSGYSFLGHFSNAAGGQQSLDSPGSCMREFTTPTFFECAGATGECRFQSDQHE